MSRNIFNSVKLSIPKRNKFDLTHDVKMSGKIGTLYPVLSLECVPGDHFSLGCDSLIRFAPLLAPIMHRVDVSVHYFFVPNRLVWAGWEDFIVGNEEANPVMPTFEITSAISAQSKQFLDYFGIPPIEGGGTSTTVSALAMAAYQKIYNEYYRDQNLVEPVEDQLSDGANTLTDFAVLRQRAWEHDYFTAALPFAQKGAQVDIPLGDVVLKENWRDLDTPEFVDEDGNPFSSTANVVTMDVSGDKQVRMDDGATTTGPYAYNPKSSLEMMPTPINDLKRAFKLQDFLQRNARGGTRYVESILAHFGVRSPDKRLQRPEYITGIKSPVIISEVLNTNGPFDTWNGTDMQQTGNAQGDMAGHGVAVTSGKSGGYFCEEHGYIIGILSVMPRSAYQNGIPKHFLKRDYLDYYFPSFAHIGEQEVQNQEVWAYGGSAQGTFGYVPRYAEYKYMPSRVAGDFRTTLNYWHMGRIFASQPSLNQEFIECEQAEVSRVFAVTDPTSDVLWMHLLHKITARRPMPVFGTPSI